MAKTVLGKVGRGLTNLTRNAADVAAAVTGSSTESEIARRVAEDFKDLAEAEPGLPADAGTYVASGRNPSVLSTLSTSAAHAAWSNRDKAYQLHDSSYLFRSGPEWSGVQVQRLGEVLEKLTPDTCGYFGTENSPDWWRRVMTLWMGHHRKDHSLDRLAAFAAKCDLGILAVLDILLCHEASRYGDSNSVAHFADVGGWLDRHADDVIPVITDLTVEECVALAEAVSHFALATRYLAPLLDLAVAPLKMVRTAARLALSGADPAKLIVRLAARYAPAATGVRLRLIEVAAMLGARAQALLAGWREGETATRIVAALDRAMDAASAEPIAPADNPPDGPDGYTAIDGRFVVAPPRLPMPAASPIADAAFDALKPAADAYNAERAAARAEAIRNKSQRLRDSPPIGANNFAAIRKLGEGSKAIGKWQPTALDWIYPYKPLHPGVLAFFKHDSLTLRHTVRFAVASTEGNFNKVFNDWIGPGAGALAQHIAQGADPRLVLDLWVAVGGQDPIVEHLTGLYHNPLTGVDATFWPALCDRFDLLDEGLGLKPQSGKEPRLRGVLDLLALFPAVPRRYWQPLMLLAIGKGATAAAAARTLLQDAPDIDDVIVRRLEDRRADVRARAADWLMQRDARGRVDALQTALKTERSEIARAAMTIAIERLGGNISDAFDGAAMLREAEAGLAKTDQKGLEWFPFDQLPALHWRDGTPLDPRLPRWWLTLANKLKQPGGNALTEPWLDRLAAADAQALGSFIVTVWIEQDIQNYETSYTNNGASVTGSKGILALATRANGTDAAQKVAAFLKRFGDRTSQAKSLLDMLASNPANAALQVVLAAANHAKQATVQAHASALVERIAARHGWTIEELADRTIPGAGLDADGALALECGRERPYALRLGERDVLVLHNPEGKPVKTLPAPRTDEETLLIEAARTLMAATRKEAKRIFAEQTARLREAMCAGRRWKVDHWQTFLAGHLLVGRLTQRLIWLGLDAEGATIGSFRPLGDGSYSGAADEAVELSRFAGIALAHHSLLAPVAITAWRQHLADYEVAAPFNQISRSPPVLSDADRPLREIRDRKGWMIETLKLHGAATRLGYDRARSEDSGRFTRYERVYHSIGVFAEIEFTGAAYFAPNARAALLALRFWRIPERGDCEQMALGDVPPVVLAESWQDLHDIADKGSGFNPDWQKLSNE